MVPDQSYQPEATNALLELNPITADDRWWCNQASPAELESWRCVIFTETGQQLGGEQGLELFEILASQGNFLAPDGFEPTNVAILVTEFARDIGATFDIAVTTLPDQEFGSRHLNGYYEALVLPAT